ncbi:unannotated protein [freshwater metagenome]|uniref:Unannotated protein n=1 Tax=freshwater metagenome TaxID=449393 RepID=A0A6J7IFC6_9ZZZZ|nr:hypothetical protein [Actinomycetota bacterium]
MSLTSDQAKQLVMDFFKVAFGDKDPDRAAQLYMAEPYVQHNPQVADGLDGFRAGVGGMLQAFPQMRTEIKRVVSDGEHVVVHQHLFMVPEGNGTAAVDMFRIKDGRIVEHWDVYQDVPSEAANDNTMF